MSFQYALRYPDVSLKLVYNWFSHTNACNSKQKIKMPREAGLHMQDTAEQLRAHTQTKKYWSLPYSRKSANKKNSNWQLNMWTCCHTSGFVCCHCISLTLTIMFTGYYYTNPPVSRISSQSSDCALLLIQDSLTYNYHSCIKDRESKRRLKKTP